MQGNGLPETDLIVIRTLPFQAEMVELVTRILLRHDCQLCLFADYSVVLFPRGTRKEEQIRTRNVRYNLYLPDGAVFMEEVSREGKSCLGFDSSEFHVQDVTTPPG